MNIDLIAVVGIVLLIGFIAGLFRFVIYGLVGIVKLFLFIILGIAGLFAWVIHKALDH